VRLGVDAATAFVTYAGRIGEWWPSAYSAGPDTLETVVMEPGVGGRVYERHTGDQEYEWGRVTVWQPGEALAYTSMMAQNRDFPSEVRVQFVEEPAGCRVDFTHGGWVEENVADRAKFSDWPVILASFAAIAEAPAGS
jgi:hypothetical protein